MMRKFQKQPNGDHLASFDTLSDYIAIVNTPPTDEGNRTDWQNFKDSCSDFTARESHASLTAQLTDPPKVAHDLTEALGDLRSLLEHQETLRRLLYRQEDGEELDPVAWMQRDCNGWTRIDRTQQKSPRIFSIGISCALNCGHEPETLRHRGAALVALIDAIEANGDRAEVTAILYNGTYLEGDAPNFNTRSKKSPGPRTGPHYTTTCRLKDAGDPLDLDKIALVACNAGFLRVFGFMANCSLVKRSISPVQGFPCDVRPEAKSLFDVFLDYDIATTEAAAEAVTTQLTKLKG